MKKTVSLFLSLMLVLAIFVCASVTASAASIGDLEFTLNSDGKSYFVTGCAEDISGDVVIPSTYNGLPVTRIGDCAFYGVKGIENVEIQEGVESIDAHAFRWSSVKHVYLPNSLKEIGWEAFFGTPLEEVKLPGNLEVLESWAFSSCLNLKTVEIPNGITVIDVCTFQNCKNLETIIIPSSVTSIQFSAFIGCEGLSDIYYRGTAKQWANIVVDNEYNGNDYFLNATVHYNYVPVTLKYINGVWCSTNPDGTRVNYTGIVEYNGAEYYVVNGVVDRDYYGLALCDSRWYYISGGCLNRGYTGLICYNDVWYYLYEGYLNWNKDTLTYYNGVWYCVRDGQIDWNSNYILDTDGSARGYYTRNGVVDWNYTGLAQVLGYDGKIGDYWYYVENGCQSRSYTGLVEYAGDWYYVQDGYMKSNYTGLVEYAGDRYYVQNGWMNSSYTGLVKYAGDWYYIQNGWMNSSYTGLVEYAGDWYYVENGCQSRSYTGLVEYAGDWYYVQNGQMNSSYTGLVEYAGDWYYVQNGWMNPYYIGLVEYAGDWYYVQNGWMNSSYTGLVEYAGDWYYVQSGWMNPYYTGIVEYEGSLFYVTNAWLNWGYNGIVEQDGEKYEVVNGVATLITMPQTKEEVLAFYQSAAQDIAENGSAGYNKKDWQSIDKMSFTGAGGNLLQPIIEGFMTKEENAEVQASEKGSDDAKNRMPISNCTADTVESATIETKGDNYLITIVMKEQVNPEKTDVDGIAVMSDNILYASDVIEIIETDDTINKVIKEVNNLTLDYKEYTIQAEMTKDGKLVNITQIGVMDVAADAKLVVGSTQVEGTITFNTVYSDFQY